MAMDSECRGTKSTLLLGFYRSAFERATTFRRAAGYFSASVLQAAYNPIVGFFERGGHIELVCCGHFQKVDIESIVGGFRDIPKWSRLAVEELKERGCSYLDLLSWAVANGRVHLKVAIIKGTDRGIYHEKFGVFCDMGDPFLAFEGSANETGSAYRYNYERVNLYWSDSASGRNRQEILVKQFEQLWKNATPGLKSCPFNVPCWMG